MIKAYNVGMEAFNVRLTPHWQILEDVVPTRAKLRAKLVQFGDRWTPFLPIESSTCSPCP